VLKIIMLVALGFLAASLLALMLAPFLWRRAVRLTTRRIQGTTPLSMSDIQADKDQLRAEFAMSTRKLEMNVEDLKQRTTGQLVDISQQSDRLNQLSAELKEKSDIVVEYEVTLNQNKDKLLRAEDEARGHLQSYKDATVKLRQARDEVEEISHQQTAARLTVDEQKVELAALKTRLAGEEQSVLDLTAERDKLAAQASEAVEQLKKLNDDYDALKLTSDDRGNRLEKATADSASAIETRDAALNELEELRTEVGDLRQQAQNGWDEERMENALLRERLNDVAAEVARMTLAFEESSPELQNIIDQDAPAEATEAVQENGGKRRTRKTTAAKNDNKGKSLADRIRALQAQVSRA
jgi:chromosome segregation ATPase